MPNPLHSSIPSILCFVVLLFFSHVHSTPSCNIKTLSLNTLVNDFEINANSFTYFTLPYPSSRILFSHIIFQFEQGVVDQQCIEGFNYTIFVDNGLNENLCADNTNYNLKYSTVNTTFLLVFDASVNHSDFYLGIILNHSNNNCSIAKLSLYIDVVCPTICPVRSTCTKIGCECLPNIYGTNCTINGECDPFNSEQDSCVVNNGIGDKECVLNQYANESFWGRCIINQCDIGYTLENNFCVQINSDSSDDPLTGQNNKKLVLLVAGCLICGLCLIFIVIPLFVLPLIRDYVEKRKYKAIQ